MQWFSKRFKNIRIMVQNEMNLCKLNYQICPKHTHTYYKNAYKKHWELLYPNTFVPNMHRYNNVPLVFAPLKTLIKASTFVPNINTYITILLYPLCHMILLINNSLIPCMHTYDKNGMLFLEQMLNLMQVKHWSHAYTHMIRMALSFLKQC